jgi:cell division protein FtsB
MPLNSISPNAQQDHHVAAALGEHAIAIRELCKRSIDNVIEVGRRLAEAKTIAGHGNWSAWLDHEFKWTDDTARNFMRVFELSKSRNFRDLSLPVSALYMIAAPSTPDEVRDEVLERAQAGEPVSVAEIKAAIAEQKAAVADEPAGETEGETEEETEDEDEIDDEIDDEVEAERPVNAVGKPMSPKYDPRYKIKTPLSKISRLRKLNKPRGEDIARLERENIALQSEVQELANEIEDLKAERDQPRAAEIKIAGLESEIEELKTERDQLRGRVAELEGVIATCAVIEKPKRRRGRPPGSPNKPKPPAAPAPVGVTEPMPEFLKRAS